jgi:hypothetical protein
MERNINMNLYVSAIDAESIPRPSSVLAPPDDRRQVAGDVTSCLVDVPSRHVRCYRTPHQPDEVERSVT